MLTRGLSFGTNHPWITLLFLSVVTLMAGLGLPRLQIDDDFDLLIDENSQEKVDYDRIQRLFGSEKRTIIVLRDSDLWVKEKLEALRVIHHTLETLPFISRVESLVNAKGVTSLGGRTVVQDVFAGVDGGDLSAINEVRSKALRNPLLIGTILSPQADVTALLLTMDQTSKAVDSEIYKKIQDIIDAKSGLYDAVFQVGSARINAELKQGLVQDITTLAPLSALVLFISIVFFLRSFFAALIPLAFGMLTLVWSFGFMGWMGLPVTVLIAMLPSLILVIGATEDTYLFSAYLQGISMQPEVKRQWATQFMLKHMGVPLLLTTLTTALGFMSNLLSPMTMIRDFSLVASFAIVSNGVITLMLLPLLLNHFGPLKTKVMTPKGKAYGLPGLIVSGFEVAILHYPKIVLIFTLFLTAFFLNQAISLQVTNDPFSYFRPEQSVVRHVDQVHETLMGIRTFRVAFESDQDGMFRDPKQLKKLEMMGTFLSDQGVYDGSFSLADPISWLNQLHNQDSPSFYRIPDNEKQLEIYLDHLKSYDLSSVVSSDFRHAVVFVRHNIHDAKTLSHAIHETQKEAQRLAGSMMSVHVTGEQLLVNSAASSLIKAQAVSLVLLLVVMFILMSLMFTSIKGGLISLVPSLIPIILLFGWMGFLGLSVNPGTAMLAVIAIGIAIDDTIHMLSRYNETRRHIPNSVIAMRHTLRSEGVPVVATTFSLIVGFSVLMFSKFSLIAQFGALAAATMMFALLANLLVTPILMVRIRLVGLSQILGLDVQKNVIEQSPLFQGMSLYQIRKAVLISEIHTFKKGDLLVKQYEVGRNLALILSGKVDVTLDNHQKTLVATLGAGEVFGEIGFVKEIQRTANVRAVTNVEVLVFNFEKMQANMKYFPRIYAQLNLNISRILGLRLADTTARIMRLQGSERMRKPDYE